MSEPDSNQPVAPHRPLSIGRILLLVIPAAAIIGYFYWQSSAMEAEARVSAPNTIARMFPSETVVQEGEMGFADTDRDDVADTPQDQAILISPDELVFSFVAGEVESV